MASKTNDTFIIRDALLYLPDGSTKEGDCLVEDGKIAELGSVTGSAPRELDAAGLWLFPGAFDALHIGTIANKEPANCIAPLRWILPAYNGPTLPS